MRRANALRTVALLALACAAGCSENRGKLEGTQWRSEAAKIKLKGYVYGRGGAQTVSVPEGFMELHFHEDGSLFYIIQGKLHTGKWKFSAGSLITMDLDKPLAGRKVHSEKVVIEGDRMTMTDSDGTQLSFRKVN